MKQTTIPAPKARESEEDNARKLQAGRYLISKSKSC